MARFAALVSVTALLAACSIIAPGDDEFLGGGSKAAAGAGGNSGAAGSAGKGGTAGSAGSSGAAGSAGSSGGSAGSSGGAGGASGGSAGASGGAGGTGGVSCVSGTSAAQARGIALHLVVDRTPSMGSSFSEIRSGVDQYLTAQAALTGTDVGLSFAPLKNGSASCSGAGYDPPEVPFGPLPGHANAITNALQGLNTGGMPKLVAVLQGGSAALTSFTPAGDKQPVLAVITDWQPFSDGCSSSSSTLTAAAAAALSTPPHTMTWILDLGGQSSTLDGIAKSGGSEKALDNIDSPSEIRDALLEATRPCRFAAPPNSAGGALSLSRKSPSPQLYSEVSSIAACGNNNNRWFALGDTLVLCPRACNNQLNNAIYEINVACGS